MLILSVFTFCLLINSCNSQIGTTYFLEENDSSVIIDINSIDVLGKRILITDDKSGDIFIFNLLDGSLVRKISPSIFFSDSVAIKIKGYKTVNNRIYVTLKELFEYKGGEYNPQSLSKWVQNKFIKSYFINDTMIISTCACAVNSVSRDETISPDWLWGIENRIVLVKTNINTGKCKINIIEEPHYRGKDKYTPNKIFFIDLFKRRLLIDLYYNKYKKNQKLDDTIYQMAYYDLDGNWINWYNQTPDLNRKLGKYSSLNSIIGVMDDKGDFIFAYKFLPFIYINNLPIELKDFPFENDLLTDNINVDKLGDLIQKNEMISDFDILSICTYHKNILIYIVDIKDDEWDLSLLEYTKDGRFVKSYKLYRKSLELIPPIIYYNENRNGNFIVIRQYKEGWEVEIVDNIDSILH